MVGETLEIFAFHDTYRDSLASEKELISSQSPPKTISKWWPQQHAPQPQATIRVCP
jgi:hypothetical protein